MYIRKSLKLFKVLISYLKYNTEFVLKLEYESYANRMTPTCEVCVFDGMLTLHK